MIAIIFSTWNGLEYTKRAVASIRTKHPYKLIIVDDGSTDGTTEWAEQQGYVLIRARPPTLSDGYNPGRVGYNYNLAMRKAVELGCSHMVFAHNDLLFHKDAIDNLVKLYEEKRSAGYFFHSGIASGGKLIEMGLDKGLETKVEDLDKMIPEDYVDTPFLVLFIMTKETVDKLGPFDEKLTDGTMNLDGDWKHRMNLLGGLPPKYSGSRLAWFYHFSGTTSKTNNLDVQKMGDESNNYYMAKWGGFWNLEKFRTPFGGMTDVMKCPWCPWEGERSSFVPHLLRSCPNYPPWKKK